MANYHIILVLVILHIISLCECAPLKNAIHKKKISSHLEKAVEKVNTRTKRSPVFNALHDDEAKLSIVINKDSDIDLQKLFSNRQERNSNDKIKEVVSRNKRSVVEEGTQHASDRKSRQRRTAGPMFLSAAMKICEQYRALCRRIEVEDEDVKLAIKLADM